KEALPDTGLDRDTFWKDFENLIDDLTPKNRKLLKERERLQTEMEQWLQDHNAQDFVAFKSFLRDIGYLETEVNDFTIATDRIDDVIAKQVGPQLVVPMDNARYALNAANARWGSLYDALRSEEHTSELQSRFDLVCRLLLVIKKIKEF